MLHLLPHLDQRLAYRRGLSHAGLIASIVWLSGSYLRSQPPAVDAVDAYPPGELGEVVRLGEALIRETHEHPLSKAYIGNALNCTSCHLDAGSHPTAASFIGVAAAYPAWSPRENQVVTLENRISNCFIRSQNGKRPQVGGEVSVAIAAYITWLSRGTPIEMNPSRPLGPRHIPAIGLNEGVPDEKRGAALYATRCADCHGDQGAGGADGPPVWGEHSFNDGAGLSNVSNLAAWLKVAMPLDDADLSDQEAYDIAAFINSHPRPKFDLSLLK